MINTKSFLLPSGLEGASAQAPCVNKGFPDSKKKIVSCSAFVFASMESLISQARKSPNPSFNIRNKRNGVHVDSYIIAVSGYEPSNSPAGITNVCAAQTS